jgi:molybdate-binding protein/DNA-binding XRE family transcriptional regulator
MKKRAAAEVENRLSGLRRKRGFSAAWLANAVGVSRQTIYAIEGGSYVPNTAVALRLAGLLEARVEDLFTLAEKAPAQDLPSRDVVLLPGSDLVEQGQPVQLCRVDGHLVASASSAAPCFFPASDGIVAGKASGGRKAKVRLYAEDGDFGKRILIAGCDPGISVLARHAAAAGLELVLAHRNSSQALSLLKEGAVHIAGTHLRDEASGESNLPAIRRMFPTSAVAAVSFAVWEEGLLTARGNPKGIAGIGDLARKDVRLVNREKGSGSRLLLDSHLGRLKINAKSVRGYDLLATGHLPAAWQVRNGEADCCVATRGAARAFGLGFLPLVSERYDFAIRKTHLSLPAIQTLLDTLNRASFRRELENLGGYDTALTGQRIL